MHCNVQHMNVQHMCMKSAGNRHGLHGRIDKDIQLFSQLLASQPNYMPSSEAEGQIARKSWLSLQNEYFTELLKTHVEENVLIITPVSTPKTIFWFNIA